MTRIGSTQFEVILAFGNASIAACNAKELARRGQLSDETNDLLVEIKAAHVRLRELFSEGLDDAVLVLARDVMDLASRATEILDQEKWPSGS